MRAVVGLRARRAGVLVQRWQPGFAQRIWRNRVGGAQSPASIAHQPFFKYDRLLAIARPVNRGEDQMSFAKVDDELAVERDVIKALDQSASLREVADQGRPIVVAEDRTHLAVHRHPVAALLCRAGRRDDPFPLVESVGEFVRGDRLTVDVALNMTDPKRPNEIELIVRFNAFGGGLHSQCLGERDDCRYDSPVARPRQRCRTNKALVDFDFIERRSAKVAERRIARPKIVESEPHPDLLQRGEHGVGRSRITEEHAFCDLKLEPVGRKPGRCESGSYDRGQRAVGELDRGDVHRDPDASRPTGRVLAGLAQDPFAQRADKIGFFGNRDEHSG